MKKIRKMLALALAMVMVLAIGATVFAAPVANEHTITITNTDQNVSHTYEAYQVFSGNLDSKELVLADIEWGTGVNGTALQAALVATTDPALLTTAAGKDALGKDIAAGKSIFANCTSAQDVAKVMATLQSTGQKYDANGKPTTDDGTADNAGAIDAVATIIANNLATKTADFTADASDATKYTATVPTDGYYFIKDVTTNLNNETDKTSDTKSKYLLSVVKDVTIVAKDTGLEPDKKILNAEEQKVAADSAAIGDTVNFEVTIEVPNTKKYEEKFWFVMNDTLPEGITFTGITSVDINGTALTDTAKASPAPDLTDANYNGSAGYYTLAVTNADNSANSYAWEATGYDAVKEAGGQAIAITFNQFKKFVETKDLIGKTVTVKYTGVVNDDAKFDGTANENEVEFKFSNDPNHDYDGDTPTDDSVTGTTPKVKTRSYTTSLKIKKVDENGQPLAGATFELKGTALNRTVLTGYKFVEESYTPANGEEIDGTATYWLLKDGTYTTTDPSTVQNTTQYAEPTSKKYFKVTYTRDEVAAKETDIVLVTGADGVAEFIGLNEGTDYTLEEIAAPEGYNKIDGKSAITITWTDPETIDPTTGADADAQAALSAQKAQGGFTLTATQFASSTTWNSEDKQFEVTIENKKGSVLPSTGGIGTTIFYVIGAILVLGAGILLVTRRRMNAN
jgi:fimbrial isopeptide formation D2 family protein/LPXTG-motif cell wall-anchored protein